MAKKKVSENRIAPHIKTVDDLLTSDDITNLLEKIVKEKSKMNGLVVCYMNHDDLLVTKTAGVDFYQTLGILDVAKAWAIENLGHWED